MAISLSVSVQVAADRRAPAAVPGMKAKIQRDADTYLRERSTKEHLSALSLAVSLGADQPTIEVTAGTTIFRTGHGATPSDLYQIGSNTKAFTAGAIVPLDAQRRLSIDAPLGDYRPQYPAYRGLTLRQLLSMTSGVESDDNTSSWERSFARYPTANVSADSLIRLVYPSIEFRPGTTYRYSNTGYLLAQEVVDARSQSKSYAKEIAAPHQTSLTTTSVIVTAPHFGGSKVEFSHRRALAGRAGNVRQNGAAS